MPLISRVAPFHNALVQKLSELGIAYKGSPIVEGPGEEYFDDSMRGGKGIRTAIYSWSMTRKFGERGRQASPRLL
jgi:hypothetical protein